MKNKKIHADLGSEKWVKSLPGLDLEYKKPAEKVWNDLERAIDARQESVTPEIRLVSYQRTWLAAAAVFFVLLGSTLFLRFFTETVYAPAGEHLAVVLPDGSEVRLNAGSNIAYKPYWWRFNRELELKGEAFFEVEEGSKFEVLSASGRTIVLGTSFNVYARENLFKVTCFSGEVKVVSNMSGHSLNIGPNEEASLNKDGSLRLSKVKDAGESASWINDMFIFTAMPLPMVFDEIERQYAVDIRMDKEFDYLYTGNFSRSQSLEKVLKMVCRPYGLQFQKADNGTLIIYE